MTKRYSILRKKLKELESQLDNICSLPADPPIFHQLLSDDFHQRLAFVKSLLSAEIASHPTKPHHLNHIAQRLDYIDSTFHEWDTSSLPSPSSALHHVDSASTCSCTDSCLNDDGEVSGDYEEDPERVAEENSSAMVEYRGGLFERKTAEVPVLEYSNCLFEEEDKGKEERVEEEKGQGEGERLMVEIDGKVARKDKAAEGFGVGRLCGAVAFGVVLGMVVMGGLSMVMLYGGDFQYGVDETFLIPT